MLRNSLSIQAVVNEIFVGVTSSKKKRTFGLKNKLRNIEANYTKIEIAEL